MTCDHEDWWMESELEKEGFGYKMKMECTSCGQTWVMRDAWIKSVDWGDMGDGVQITDVTFTEIRQEIEE